MTQSRILSFYRNGVDDYGRTFDQILHWDRDRLEFTHNYIQWLFPLRERSGANPGAPTLSAADIQAFRTDPTLQKQLLRALSLMLDFYGLKLVNEPTLRVQRRHDFDECAANWLQSYNHNFLRVTRILRSLRTLGLGSYASVLFEALHAIYQQHAAVIGAETYEYWQRAMLDRTLDAD
jgi:hypothetical protein